MKTFLSEQDAIDQIGTDAVNSINTFAINKVNDEIKRIKQQRIFDKYIFGGFSLGLPAGSKFESVWIEFKATRTHPEHFVFEMIVTQVIVYNGIPDEILDRMNELKAIKKA